MTKEIQLTQGKVALVDDEDFEYLSRWKWYYAQGYASRQETISRGIQKTIRMHRQIMNTPEGMETDHINRNKMDNQKENLRICTTLENNRNSDVRKDNTSGYRGVVWYKDTRKWRAQINVCGKKIGLGYFDDVKKAIEAYDSAAKKYHGDFASLNGDQHG